MTKPGAMLECLTLCADTKLEPVKSCSTHVQARRTRINVRANMMVKAHAASLDGMPIAR
jgi:hypothetical protein